MDILNRAAGKVGETATQAAATAAQWYRLDSEQRGLAKLRARALQTRAQIGEEMYKLWHAGALPSSNLDHLFQEIDRLTLTIDAQRVRVEDLRAHFTGDAPPAVPLTILDQQSHLQVVEDAQPPAPVPPTIRIAGSLPATGDSPAPAEPSSVPCPSCARPGPAGKAFCGYCGARLQ